MTRHLKIYRRLTFYLRIILRLLLKHKKIEYTIYGKFDVLLKNKKIQFERLVKQRGLTNGFIVAEYKKLLALLLKLNVFKTVPTTGCILVNGKRVCGVFEKDLSQITKQLLSDVLGTVRLFVKKYLFARVTYQKIPSSVQILKKKADRVVFLRKGVQWNQTIRRINPVLKLKVKKIVVRRLKSILEVKTFIEAKKTTNFADTWKVLVQDFRPLVAKTIKTVLKLPNISNLRKTTLQDVTASKAGQPVETKEIVRIPSSLTELADKDLTQILLNEIDYFN